jgi:hypothetical protein
MWNLRWKNGTEARFSPNTSVFPCQLSFHQWSILVCHHGLVQEVHLRRNNQGIRSRLIRTNIKPLLLVPSLQFHFSYIIPYNFSNLNGPSHFLWPSGLLPKILFVTLVSPILYKYLSHFNPLLLVFTSWSGVLHLREDQDSNIWRQASCTETPKRRTLGRLKKAIKARQSQ